MPIKKAQKRSRRWFARITTRSATKNKGKKRNLAKMQGSKNGKLGGAREGKEHSTALMKSKNDADQSRSVQDGKVKSVLLYLCTFAGKPPASTATLHLPCLPLLVGMEGASTSQSLFELPQLGNARCCLVGARRPCVCIRSTRYRGRYSYGQSTVQYSIRSTAWHYAH